MLGLGFSKEYIMDKLKIGRATYYTYKATRSYVHMTDGLWEKMDDMLKRGCTEK